MSWIIVSSLSSFLSLSLIQYVKLVAVCSAKRLCRVMEGRRRK